MWLAMPSLQLDEALALSFNQDPDRPPRYSDKTTSNEGKLRRRFLQRTTGSSITPLGLANAAEERGWNIHKSLAALSNREAITYELANEKEIIELVSPDVVDGFTPCEVIAELKNAGIRFIKQEGQVMLHKETDLIDGAISPFRFYPYEWAPSAGRMIIGSRASGSGAMGSNSGVTIVTKKKAERPNPVSPVKATWMNKADRWIAENPHKHMSDSQLAKVLAKHLANIGVNTRHGKPPTSETIRKDFLGQYHQNRRQNSSK